MKELETTLLVVVIDDKILLSTKKRGFAKGVLNGVGGKRQENETIYEAMIRETKEEINVEPVDAKLVGIIDFILFVDSEKTKEKMHIYLTNKIIGEPTESDEMKPEWFDVNDIPYDKMFADDRFWLPEVLKGNLIRAEVEFDKEFKITSQNYEVVDNLNE